MYECEIKISALNNQMLSELSNNFYKYCSSCSRYIVITPENYSFVPNGMLDGDFLCKFCIRHSMHKRNCLVFSLKSFILHLYDLHCSEDFENLMYRFQIEDHIREHRDAGLKNYCLAYDEDSFNWFLDLDLVGNSLGKVPQVDVFKSIIEMMLCFNPGLFSIDCRDVFFSIRDKINKSIVKNNRVPFVPCLPHHKGVYSKLRLFDLSSII